MRFQWSRYLLTSAFLSLAGCQGENLPEAQQGLETQAATAESECLEKFKDIRSCALGGAKLSESVDGVDATLLGDAATDGVSSSFDGAVAWDQQGTFENLDSLTMEALEGDKVISSLTLTRAPSVQAQGVRSAAGGEFIAHVNFQSPIGRAMLQGYLDAGITVIIDSPIYVPIYIRNGYPSGVIWGSGFSNGPRYRLGASSVKSANPIEPGACVWSLGAADGSPFEVEVEGKKYSFTKLEIIEQVSGGSYPYTSFTGINVKAKAENYKILGESITRK